MFHAVPNLTADYKIPSTTYTTHSYLVSHISNTEEKDAYLLTLSHSLASNTFPALLPLAAELQHMVHVDTDTPLPTIPLLQPS